MAGFDILALVVVGLAVIFGLIKGFFHQLLKAAGVAGIFVLLYLFLPDISGFLHSRVSMTPELSDYVSVVGVFVMLFIGFSLIIYFLRKPVGKVGFGGFDKPAGAVLGFLKGVGILAILAYALISFPAQSVRNDYFKPYLFKESWTAPKVIIAMGYIRPAFQQQFFVDAENMMKRTTEPLEVTGDDEPRD